MNPEGYRWGVLPTGGVEFSGRNITNPEITVRDNPDGTSVKIVVVIDDTDQVEPAIASLVFRPVPLYLYCLVSTEPPQPPLRFG